MKRFIALLLALTLILGAAAGCQKTEEKAEDAEKTELNTDDTGKESENAGAPSDDEKDADAPDDADTDEAVPAGNDDTGTDAYADYADEGYRPMMWRVTDGEGHELYLFGTIHAGDERMNGVMGVVTKVLADCDALAVEFDTVAYNNDIEAATRDMMQFVYQDGTTIVDHMPEELYTGAVKLLTDAGVYNQLFDYYNTAMWAQLCEQAAALIYADIGFDNAAEAHLIGFAYEHDIPVLDVESASFQYAMLNSFPEELNLILIEDTLESLDEYRDNLNELYSTWLNGDYDGLIDLVLSDYSDSELTEEEIRLLEDYDKAMLADRNLGMAEKAKEYIASGDTVFFAVGTAHMVGDAGLVRLLTDAGYTVERITY